MQRVLTKYVSSILLAVIFATTGCSSNDSSTTASTVATGTPQAVSSAVTWFIPEGAVRDAVLLENLLNAGQLSFNVRSTANNSGEISGGISPLTTVFRTDGGDPFAPNSSGSPVTFATILDGEQVRPRSIITGAKGYGSLTIDPQTKKLSGFLVTSGISGTGAQLRDGITGIDGTTVLPLEGGPVIWTVPADTLLTDAQSARLAGGAYYLTVTSSACPNGELRGQLDKQVRFASLNGANELPPVATSASGSGYLALKPSTRQFSGFVTVAGLTSTITGIFLQIGSGSVNGAPVVTLENRGNGTWTVPLNTVLNDTQVANFNSDQLYFNVHTMNHLPGEIRGQLLKSSIRIGTARLDGTQETPPVATTGSGVGAFALNSITGVLSGSVTSIGVQGTAVQLQSGPAGAAGPILTELTATPPVTTAPTTAISYSLDIQPIFTGRCAVSLCHVAGGSAPMSLEAGVSYGNVSFLITPKNAAASYLISRLTTASPLPQMPLGRTPLSSTELDLIRAWINSGAQNN